MKTGGEEQLIRRGFAARLFHAIFFEVTAVILTSLFLVFVMHENLWSMGVLSILISLIATAWNGIFNFIFDNLQKRFQFSRTANVRFLHALGFEGGLAILTVPVVALYLGIGLWPAFLLDLGLLLFFFPYSIIFNFIYDKIYIRFAQRRNIEK